MTRPFKVPQSVLVVLHDGAGQALLLQRADRADYWQSVTGSLDHVDEHPRSAAQREVAEETGISVQPEALIDTGVITRYEIFNHWRARYAPGVTHNTEFTFTLTIPRLSTIKLAPREHLSYQWCTLADAAARCFSPSNGAALLALQANSIKD